jgi:hypothetical protein
MPPHGFGGAPPSFHGELPHGHLPPDGRHYELGGHGHDLGHFNGQPFHGFNHGDHQAWRGGGWRHEWHDGHLGWWWVVGDGWYFYPEPIFPYPDYVGANYWYDYYQDYPPPAHYWYYCEYPPGYYPDVQSCGQDWEPVPPEGP